MSALPLRRDDAPLARMRVRCRCAPGRDLVPLRVSAEVAAQLRALIQGTSAADPAAPLLTYQCRRCSDVVTLTLGDLELT